MKDTVIKMGVSIGLDAKKVDEMYMKTYNEKFAETNDAAKSTQYTIITLKRYFQNYNRKSGNTVDIEAIVLGNSITDWGQIMRRKHGTVYPDGHNNAGKPIPEHDFDNKIILLNLSNNNIMSVSYKSQDENKIKSVKIVPGSHVKVKLEKGRKEGFLIWSEGLSELNIVKQLSYSELQTILLQHAKDYLVDTVSDLCKGATGIKIVNSDVVDVDKRQSRFGNVILIPNDTKISEDSIKTIEITMPVESFNYTEDVKNLIIVCELSKIEEKVISYKGYSAFADNQYLINAVKIENEVEENLL